MADDFRRMPLSTKMNPFQAEICGHQHFVNGRNSQDCAVVADPGRYTEHRTLLSAYAGNERFFAERQAASIYKIALKRRLILIWPIGQANSVYADLLSSACAADK